MFKTIWVYVIVISGGQILEEPLAVAVGNSEHECFVHGARWLAARPVYRNLFALCYRNDSVDEELPRMRWL